MVLSKLGRFNEAVDTFDVAIEINPKDSIVFTLKGEL